MAVGPAALALQTGAALFTVGIHYERLPAGRHGIVITWHPQVETADVGKGRGAVTTLTQRCADQLAASVREHPQDWHMLQRIFLDQ
jgi:phosphatidylinositol dimannoside acyltransferase